MKTSGIGTMVGLIGVLGVAAHCSSSLKAHSPDGSTGKDAQAGTGGAVPAGTGGSIVVGAGGVAADAQPDLTMGAGGAGDANRDVAPSSGTGGLIGAGGGLGKGGNSAGGTATGGRPGTGGTILDAATPGTGGVPADGGGRFAMGYLSWQAPQGSGDAATGTGPAVVVSGEDGLLKAWVSVNAFPPETPPANPSTTQTLTGAQIEDLFSRLAGVSLTSLPHEPLTAFHCLPKLYFRLCAGCAATTLSYPSAKSIAPEMEPVWAWFDGISGLATTTNPRIFCSVR